MVLITNDHINILRKCPCGGIPESLCLSHSVSGYQWAFLTPTCCNSWCVEFKTNGLSIDDPKCIDLATMAWNNNPRDKG